MNDKRKNRRALALVTCAIVSAFAVGCADGKTPETPGGKDPETPAPSVVDRSDLGYYQALASYKKTDFTAKWIWTQKSNQNSYVAFRKTFELDKAPTSAIASISAESKYTLWVNGELVVVDGSPKRGATPYDAYYEDVDLGGKLKVGKNAIVALVAYNGRGGNSSVDPGRGGFLFELDADGTKIASDKSFKAQRLRAYKNKSLLGADWPNYSQSSMLAEWDVYYDARDAVGDYTAVDYDDSAWENATEIAAAGESPFNDLYKSVTPLVAFDKEYTFLTGESLGVKLTQKATLTFDLPANLQFSPYFELTADSAGLRFTYYTDTLTSQGMDSFKDDYVTISGKQTYESYPWRTGSKLIIEAPAGITFEKVGVRISEYDSDTVGVFESGNAKLDTLWQKAGNTLKICMRDTYMDCPERERSPYIGDAANQISETFYALDEKSWELTKKTLLAAVGWTKTDKCIPLRSPSMTVNECPAQTLNFLVSAYEYYMYTGDAETMKLFYPVARDYLKLWSLNPDGSIVYRNGSFQWVDWGDGSDNEVLQNCWYYYALKSMNALANELGITADDAFYAEREQKVKSGFAKFKKEGGFTSGTAYDDRANAMAVVAGLADKSDHAAILNVLKTVEKASPYMEKFVLEALCVMGEYDTAITRMLKRYDPMIADECTTLWELWKKTDGTVNHGWTGGPLTVLSKYFAGIAPAQAGYSEIRITLNPALGALKAAAKTPAGMLSYDMKEADGTYTVKLELPAAGTLEIPESMGKSVSVVGGTSEKSERDRFIAISLGKGTYTVTVSA